MTDQKNIFTFKDERPQQCPSLEYSTDFLQNKVPLVIDNGMYFLLIYREVFFVIELSQVHLLQASLFELTAIC